jgi:hypothetical protein
VSADKTHQLRHRMVAAQIPTLGEATPENRGNR